MSTIIYRGYDAAGLALQYDNARAVPNHADIIAETARASEAYRQRHAGCRIDVPYGPSPRQAVDIYPTPITPDDGGGAPVLFFIHGGFWVRRDKRDFGFLAEAVNMAGAHVVNVEYDLCPTVTLPQLVEQVRTAFAWTHAHAAEFGGNPAALHVAGHSAGGHLAAMLAVTDWTAYGLPADVVKSVTAISGIFDLEPIVQIPLNEQVKLDAATARAMSPVFGTPRTDLPILVAVGGAETAEFVRQSRALVHTWRTEGCDVEALEPEGEDHFTILRALGDAQHAMTEGLLRIMGLF